MIRVATNRGLDGKFQKVKDMLEGYRDRYLELMSANLISVSPVDTGTYITSHTLSLSESPATNSSAGKPGKQPYQPFAQEGFENLLNDISSLGPEAISVVFSNKAEHRDEVEDEHGYLVYTQTRREHGRIAKQAAQDVRT